VLQYVVVCCSMLQCVAVHKHNPTMRVGASFRCTLCCSVLQGVVVCCSLLQGVAGCCTVWHYVALRCSVEVHEHNPNNARRRSISVHYVLQCVAVCCSVLQCVAVCCSVL